MRRNSLRTTIKLSSRHLSDAVPRVARLACRLKTLTEAGLDHSHVPYASLEGLDKLRPATQNLLDIPAARLAIDFACCLCSRCGQLLKKSQEATTVSIFDIYIYIYSVASSLKRARKQPHCKHIYISRSPFAGPSKIGAAPTIVEGCVRGPRQLEVRTRRASGSWSATLVSSAS